MKTLAAVLLALFLAAVACRGANADMKKVDKLRKFYKEHNLDFFGELIADSSDIMADEVKHAKLELLADDARTKALAQLDTLLKTASKGSAGAMEAELLLRKASLLSDRARTATYFLNNPFKASKLKHPSEYLRESIRVFQKIEARYGTHPRMDVVTFSIAYNYGELKQNENAFKYYDRLVSRFPESPLVGDAQLALAEILFDKRMFAQALARLKAIVKAEHPRLKNFALYKMAWTYYNMADLDSGILSLEQVIEGVNNAGVQRARLELRKEALHDLVAMYAEKPDAPKAAAQATDYFERVARTPESIAAELRAQREKRLAALQEKNLALPEEDTQEYLLSEPKELLLRLVQVYRDQGKHESSMAVADQLIALLDRHPRAPALHRLRAESAEKLRNRDRVVTELERLVSLVERDLEPVREYRDGLPKAKLSGLPEALAKEKSPTAKPAERAHTPDTTKWSAYQRQLAKVAQETFTDFANFLHGEWLKTSSPETARHALSIYDLAMRALLEPWRGAPLENAFELRMHRAQLRYALKKWDPAAQDFHWIAIHRTSPEAAITEAVRGEIAALEALLKEQPIKIVAEEELHPVHARILEAYDAHLSRYLLDSAKREATADILSASARLLREYGRSDAALARLIYYSRRFSDQKDAIAITRDTLALLAQASRWEELRDFSESLLSKGTYKNSEIDKEISKSHEYASLRLLEQLEKDKNWERAAKEFASFAKNNPTSTFASQALLKSANAALETKNADSAVLRLEEATQAPDESVRLKAWLGLEPFYRKAFQWARLRELYESVLKLKADAKTVAAARENLKAIQGFDAVEFHAAGEKLVATDPDLAIAHKAQGRLELEARPFRALRYVKSNNNPSQNFKKKADLHAKLAALADELAKGAPRSLKGAMSIWAASVKAEALLEFAETLETAAPPAVLSQAGEADRKAYAETIQNQARELREAAAKLALEAMERTSQVDSPFALEDRINALLERTGQALRVSRPKVSVLWSKRPSSLALKTEREPRPRKCFELGLRALKAEGSDEARELQLKLAREYLEAGQSGYAYAILAALREAEKSDEIEAQSARLQFAIDLARLPARLRQAAQSDVSSAADRWDLARWLATRPDVLTKEERSWVAQMMGALLRLESAAPLVHAKQ